MRITATETMEKGAGDQQRAAADTFVSRHLTWPGTIRLHRHALGWDILRAPVNVILSPVFLLTRLAAWLFRRMRLRGAADWLGRRQIILRTSVAARVEALVVTDLLRVPLPPHAAAPDREALSIAILAAPRYRDVFRRQGSPEAARALSDRIVAAIGDYAGTRSAISEFTTALFTLAVGAIAFQALTPGVISMAPGVAGALSHSAAIEGFPLGRTLGSAWYGVFPVGPEPWMVAATVLCLVMAGAVVAAFAGILADPVQARLGIHRRRLIRLMETLEAETGGRRDGPFVAREHLLVRVFDLWDAALSVLRVLRG
ncbi:hypothetical protein E7811_03425 [Aliigemmobacter aestuarii]|uniref:Uncharacterized protein n=1 Tax=Aliigemmobacter aestuarii TaxID=1445661 RepID=A0A4S3MQI7_9RHOB|nr:DUF6635 family protein [Gemmobacter aestuarii]THD84790.1 hypothetical protein E7811_03425 [Gemmobacter aestuarii]